jgi:SAM-dependent MidA family methyltransferase
MHSGNPKLVNFIRDAIQARGPVPFRWFMEQALYHPTHGFYSSGRCGIGRGGDYFTNVSVGPLFGRLLAKQFCEIWERLERPANFVIVEQGAHDGVFAHDVFEAAQEEMPEFFSALTYRIVEPFPVLRDRQKAKLESFRAKTEWRDSLAELEPFVGIHFSNELIDSMPVHLVTALDKQWREEYVTLSQDGFAFVDGSLSTRQLRNHLEKISVPATRYQTEINLEALDWIEKLSARIERGFIIVVDYGFPREEFYSTERTDGTLRAVAAHRLIGSPFIDVGSTDITAHVDWTSMSEKGEQCGLTVEGFTDQHHFLTGVATAFLPNELSTGHGRALQTLLHPGLLGRTFQFLAFAKNASRVPQLTGFKFARNPRVTLGLK